MRSRNEGEPGAMGLDVLRSKGILQLGAVVLIAALLFNQVGRLLNVFGSPIIGPDYLAASAPVRKSRE
jgi:hypothetical protein